MLIYERIFRKSMDKNIKITFFFTLFIHLFKYYMIIFLLNHSLIPTPSIPSTISHITTIISAISLLLIAIRIVWLLIWWGIVIRIAILIVRIVLWWWRLRVWIMNAIRVMVNWLVWVIILWWWIRLIVWLIVRLVVRLLWRWVWRVNHMWLLWRRIWWVNLRLLNLRPWHHFFKGIKEFFFINSSIRVLINWFDSLQRLFFSNRHSNTQLLEQIIKKVSQLILI